MKKITWQEFEQVELRVGTIIEAKPFPEARNPAYKLKVDFGDRIGVKNSSAQITHHYTLEQLIGKQVIGVVNFPDKQIGPLMSQCLITGFYDDQGHVILAVPDKKINNGKKIG